MQILHVDLPAMADYYFQIGDQLAKVDGFNGLSVWRNPQDSEACLVAYEYQNVEAADRGLGAVTGIRNQMASKLDSVQPADVLRVRLAGQSSQKIYEAPSTAYLSMSIRVADPGYGPELVEEIGQIFTELSLLPGYVGSAYGTNASLEEEVIGLVTWASHDSYLGSIPPGKKPRLLSIYSRFY